MLETWKTWTVNSVDVTHRPPIAAKSVETVQYAIDSPKPYKTEVTILKVQRWIADHFKLKVMA